ncbi:GntR family transcriptional regulator [Hoeflea sp. AS16]|uniref:GntR family transcriptional regulator n=1 Tax=Hoeflea sp. AS16 TaxID=3135779 RepID=UPI00316EBC6C
MNISQPIGDSRRQTAAEEAFERLHSDIISLRLPPGTKLSEVEIAKMYQVSRQPVREAFLRLGELNLLQIRPQRATLVKRISLQDLENTRFIRAAVEVEVVRKACQTASTEDLARLEASLAPQKAAVDAADTSRMHQLDYEFHRLICESAGCLPAFRTIAENKAHTDRVCTLELSGDNGMAEILEDHTNIVRALTARDEEKAVQMTRKHLSRLDTTLTRASEKYTDYFED